MAAPVPVTMDGVARTACERRRAKPVGSAAEVFGPLSARPAALRQLLVPRG